LLSGYSKHPRQLSVVLGRRNYRQAHVKTELVIPSGGAYFEGHFPGRPILPGILELKLIVDLLKSELEIAAPLQRIVFTRFRQLVLPGDRLEISARRLPDEHIRVEAKRNEVIVAQSQLVFGQPLESGESRRRNPVSANPDLQQIALDNLLPHQPPMRFITSIVEERPDGVLCEACIPEACALSDVGAAPAFAALEAAAQAAATWEALRRRAEGGTPQPTVGYLVALRDVCLFSECAPSDRTLIIAVGLLAAAPPLTHYDVDVALDGHQLLSGKIATFLTGQTL
jgi:3-hydroxymyristoyl/3-hydroxydecanoyl-(acyl carrier protein) dehydratase